jgi:AcrR family transcriptional regulator
MSDQVIKDRLVEKAAEMFLRLGFSRVTMNDIASEMGMSKKTLYDYFASKEELLAAMMENEQKVCAAKIDALVDDKKMDFFAKLFDLLEASSTFHTRITGHFMLDIHKSAPSIAKGCDTFLKEHIPLTLRRLLQQGMEQNFIRRDIDTQLVSMVYLSAFDSMMRPEVLSNLPYSAKQVLETIGRTVFAGILTNNAREKLRKVERERTPVIE